MISRSFYAVFFFLNLLLSSYYLDSWRNPNTTSRVLQVKSLYDEGVLNIDQQHEKTIDKSLIDGHYYSDKAPFPAFLIYGICLITSSIGLLPPAPIDENIIFHLSSFFAGSLCFAFIILLLFRRLLRCGFPVQMACLLSTLPLYGSMFFIYTGTFFAHVMVVLFILLAFELISKDRNLFLAGLFSGAAFFSEYLTAIIFFIWFFQLWYGHSFRKAIYYGSGMLPFVLAFMWYNMELTGNVLTTAYTYQVHYDFVNAGFSIPDPLALFGLVFGTQKGLIWYCPVFIAFLPALSRLKREDFKGFFSNHIAFPCSVFLLLLSAFFEWRGGWSFGPRYLMPAIGLCLFAYLPLLRFEGLKKAWIWIPTGLGLIHAISAKISVQYSIPSDFVFPFTDFIWPNVLSGNFNNGAVLSKIFGLEAQPAALIFLSACAVAILGMILLMHPLKKQESSNSI